MADKETDFKLSLGVDVNEKTIDDATRKIEKKLNNFIKEGRIDVTIPIDVDNEKLTRAQKAVVEEIEKLTSKGFSAYGNNIDKLTSKLEAFEKIAKESGKDNRNPIVKNLHQYVKQIQDGYDTIKELKKQTKATKITKSKSRKDRFNPDFGVQDGEIEERIKQRLYKGIKSIGPKGFKRNVGFDSGIADSKSVMATDLGGSYQSNFARYMKISQLDALKWMKESLKNYKDNEMANLFADNAIKTGRNKNNLTQGQKYREKADIASNQMALILGGLENLRPDVVAEQFDKYLNGVLKFSEQSDKGTYDGIMLALNKAFNRYFTNKGTLGIIGDESAKGVGPGHEEAQQVLAGMIEKFKKAFEQNVTDKVIQLGNNIVRITAEQQQSLRNLARIDKKAAERELNKLLKGDTSKKSKTKDNLLERELAELEKGEQEKSKIVAENIEKAFDSKLDFKTGLEGAMCPCQSILESINSNVKLILQNLVKTAGYIPSNLPTIVKTIQSTVKKEAKKDITDKTDHNELARKKQMAEFEAQRQADIMQNIENRQNKMGMSKTTISPFQYGGFLNSLKKVLNISTPRRNAREISRMTQEEQERLRAERIARFGLTRNENDTGDLAKVFRTRSLFGWGKKRNIQNPFEGMQLSDTFNIDTTAITESLQNAIQKNMFNAQTGGGILRNIVGSMTGYIGMPSLEKSKAEADAANQLMADIRNKVQDMLNDISAKETDLRGLKASGQAVFNADGTLDMGKSSNAAITLFAQLEEKKMALKGVLADVKEIDTVVQKTNGNLTKMFKQLGFVAPELRKENKIIENINAGLDKNGRALKFQTRTAETLNYAFQLMSRHVGQMIRYWISMLNPINMIKKLFNDFASYDVKFQRTMNVIKYNLRRIVRPMMEWIAQQLVNIIGLANALIKGIGRAFGKNWDLFDKSAASAEQMREELEQAANVTASFDELHDIGTESSSNPALDLTGDIYEPQWTSLYEKVEGFGETIGEVIGKIKSFFDKIKEFFGKIKEFTAGWNFWDWLILAGAALVGYEALKALIGLFTVGKNPLQTVAEGFKFLEKAVGWAVLIEAFSDFTKELKEFIDVVGHMEPDEIKQAMIALAEGIGILVGGILLLETITAVLQKFLGFDWKSLFGLAAEVGALALFINTLTDFIDVVGHMKKEEVDQALKALAIAFTELGVAIGVLETVTALLQKFLGLDWTSLLGVAAMVSSFALFTEAMADFAEAIKGLTSEDVTNGLSLFSIALGEVTLAIIALMGVASLVPPTADLALATIALVIGSLSLLVLSLTEFVKALHDNGEDVKLFLEGVCEVIESFGTAFSTVINALGGVIIGLVDSLGNTIIGIVTSIGDTITNILDSIGNTIIGIVKTILDGIANIIKTILDGVANTIKTILDGIAKLFSTAGDTVCKVVSTIGDTVAKVITAIAEAIATALQPILDFIDDVITKILELVKVISENIGTTIKDIIKTVGDIILKIIDKLLNAIPRLLNTIITFASRIGTTIEKLANSIMRTVTRLVNFIVSAIEWTLNTVIDGVNGIISAINSVSEYVGITIPRVPKVTIQRFVPQYEQGTNYVPSDGLAYLHKGEAVIPKKYNQPFTVNNSGLEDAVYALSKQVNQINQKVDQGIAVTGQFVQRGSDLVAVVQRADNKISNTVLNNKVYAR